MSRSLDEQMELERSWEVQRVRISRLQAELSRSVVTACPGPHVLRQHRDRRQPWCSVCGRTADGVPARER